MITVVVLTLGYHVEFGLALKNENVAKTYERAMVSRGVEEYRGR